MRLLLFFFSSRRRHTRWPRDWSSDVCSSDLKIELKIDHFQILEDVPSASGVVKYGDGFYAVYTVLWVFLIYFNWQFGSSNPPSSNLFNIYIDFITTRYNMYIN